MSALRLQGAAMSRYPSEDVARFDQILPFPVRRDSPPDWLKTVRLADVAGGLRIVGTAHTIHGQMVAVAIRGVCPNVRET